MNEQNRNKIIVRTSLIGIVTNVLLAAVKAPWAFSPTPSPWCWTR